MEASTYVFLQRWSWSAYEFFENSSILTPNKIRRKGEEKRAWREVAISSLSASVPFIILPTRVILTVVHLDPHVHVIYMSIAIRCIL